MRHDPRQLGLKKPKTLRTYRYKALQDLEV
jgi:hypothetical protein